MLVIEEPASSLLHSEDGVFFHSKDLELAAEAVQQQANFKDGLAN